MGADSQKLKDKINNIIVKTVLSVYERMNCWGKGAQKSSFVK